jgi:hypothetical protein
VKIKQARAAMSHRAFCGISARHRLARTKNQQVSY